jgi:hypothetical protein
MVLRGVGMADLLSNGEPDFEALFRLDALRALDYRNMLFVFPVTGLKQFPDIRHGILLFLV